MQTESDSPDGRALDILIVEDSPIVQGLMTTVLKRDAYTLQVCSSGAEAIAIAIHAHPKLILLDVGLPDVDGFTVCRQLKALASTKDIPVIFVTGHDQTDDETMSFDAGGVDFIAKPIKPAVLQARVKAHILLQAQRRNLEGMFRDVIEYAPIMFLLADLDRNIVQTNAKAQLNLGYTPAEFKGLSLLDVIPGCAPFLQPRDTALPGPNSAAAASDYVEIACRRKDGSSFPGEVTFSLLTQSRSPMHMVVVRNISERLKYLNSLEESRQLIRELAAEHENTRENERKHIAREVHDELGQVMSALRMDLSYLNLQFGRQLPQLAGKLAEMKELTDRAIMGVRHVASVLRPEVLDWGLIPAIGWLRDEYCRHSGVDCVLECNRDEIEMPESRATLIYRIVQESLTNISRYAKASEVRIRLIFSEDECLLSVEDNGCGFDPRQLGSRRTFGLLGMRERGITLGGELLIDSVIGRGTVVSVRIPCRNAESESESDVRAAP